ncbi:hypothetical protein [Streptomyces sp. NPDC048442]|uniref:hypothetical protein n=1 Tax=Streptomyces sp. NPDC048442 TaxID=3154823 RepID=UPI0034353AC7
MAALRSVLLRSRNPLQERSVALGALCDQGLADETADLLRAVLRDRSVPAAERVVSARWLGGTLHAPDAAALALMAADAVAAEHRIELPAVAVLGTDPAAAERADRLLLPMTCDGFLHPGVRSRAVELRRWFRSARQEGPGG